MEPPTLLDRELSLQDATWKLLEKDPSSRNTLIELSLHLSGVALSKSELTEALELHLLLLEQATVKQLPYLWSSLGLIYSKLAQPEKAIDWYQRVVESGEKELLGDALHTTGINYRRLGQWKKGLEYSSRAADVKRYRHRAFAYQGAALSLENLGKIDEAREYFDKAVSLQPKSSEVLLNSAQNHILHRKYKKALQELSEAHKGQISENDRLAYSLVFPYDEAVCYLGLGQEDRYLEKLQEFLRVLDDLNPDTSMQKIFDHTWLPNSVEYLEAFVQTREYEFLMLVENSFTGAGEATVGQFRKTIQNRLAKNHSA